MLRDTTAAASAHAALVAQARTLRLAADAAPHYSKQQLATLHRDLFGDAAARLDLDALLSLALLRAVPGDAGDTRYAFTTVRARLTLPCCAVLCCAVLCAHGGVLGARCALPESERLYATAALSALCARASAARLCARRPGGARIALALALSLSALTLPCLG